MIAGALPRRRPGRRRAKFGKTGYLVGQIEGQDAAKGNVLPFNDLLIATAAIEQGYAVLTENLRHFEKVPGVRVLRL